MRARSWSAFPGRRPGRQTEHVLDEFNTVSEADLRVRLHACCAADAWIAAILAGRPYDSEAALAEASDTATAMLDDSALAEALAGHPRIGQSGTGQPADAGDGAWSRQEQAGMDHADSGTRAAIAAANAEYERRFGHVYLVCATGRGAGELLALCRSRLANSPETERGIVLAELAKINRLRLEKLLGEKGAS